MGATGFSVVSGCHNLNVYRWEDTFWSTWGSFLCCFSLRMSEAVEHIGEYYNEARSAIYPQFRCYTDPSDVGTFSFRSKFTFNFFCFIWAYKASLALYAQIKQKQSKVDFSSKAKRSNVRDFLPLIDTVLAPGWHRGSRPLIRLLWPWEMYWKTILFFSIICK